MERIRSHSKSHSAICFIAFSLLLVILTTSYGNSKYLDKITKAIKGQPENFSEFTGGDAMVNDKLLNGLIAPGYDDGGSCISRHQVFKYRKASAYKPSRYLISELRSYEDLHKRCEPHTDSYNTTLKWLESRNVNDSGSCKYIVWTPVNGLGNRILSMSAAFLYALLTNRVLLVDFGADMSGLFCEPFRNTSWLLPGDFPLRQHFGYRGYRHSHGYESQMSNGVANNSMGSVPSHVFLNLAFEDRDHDLHFSCDNRSHEFLQNVPWLILHTDEYIVPSFFLMPALKEEADKMFPEKETLFHHLGRYLFHPSNQAWGLITRFFNAYLAKADQKVGLQIRVFDTRAAPFGTVMDHLLKCLLTENLLPEIEAEESFGSSPSKNQTSKSVLVTSLFSVYYENIKNMYWSKPTATGEVIGVYQPSHEEYQHFGDNAHNVKAWAEIYLLSMTDVLVTSSWSTFGYVAQSLGGLRPWVLYRTGHGERNVEGKSCHRAISIEPCFHFPPRSFDCRENSMVDPGDILPYLKHCEDQKYGLKLISEQD